MRLRPMLAAVALSAAAAATLTPTAALAGQKQTDQRFDEYCAKEGRGTFKQGGRFCPMAIANYQIARTDLTYQLEFEEIETPSAGAEEGGHAFAGKLTTHLTGSGAKGSGKMRMVRNRYAVGTERPLRAEYTATGEFQGIGPDAGTWDCANEDLPPDTGAGLTLVGQRINRRTLRLQVAFPTPFWDCTKGGTKHFPYTLELPESDGDEWFDDYTAADYEGGVHKTKSRYGSQIRVELDTDMTYESDDIDAIVGAQQLPADRYAYRVRIRITGHIDLFKYRRQ